MKIQLTDGLAMLIADGQRLHVLRVAGRRFDCGDKLGPAHPQHLPRRTQGRFEMWVLAPTPSSNAPAANRASL
jgi:hypothetical protein